MAFHFRMVAVNHIAGTEIVDRRHICVSKHSTEPTPQIYRPLWYEKKSSYSQVRQNLFDLLR